LVLHDALDRWVASRPLWNQHAYSITNVNDDGTIPKTSQWKPNWKDDRLNNFRVNVQGSLQGRAAPDLTAAGDGPPGVHTPLTCAGGRVPRSARVSNRGAPPTAPNEPVSFYVKAASGMPPICTTQTTKPLQPGECEVVGCDWQNAPNSPMDVRV